MKSLASKTLPSVSFIIPTLNADWILEKCLKSIRRQNYPASKIEIVIADGGSQDNTLKIAQKYKARIIPNPEVLHEPGKVRASKVAKGKILFFTDADNILAHQNWLAQMVRPFTQHPEVVGFLPQTTAPPDSSGLNRYLGYLFTDPFTWFVYQAAANPRDYPRLYQPTLRTSSYVLYKFPSQDPPLFGLSQGVGTRADFQRGKMGHNDDILAGIKLMREGGVIAYVPSATIYHYHVQGLGDFWRKYRWRVRNNLLQQVKGMGLVNRQRFFGPARQLRQYLFIPYALSLVGPIFDAVRLSRKYGDPVMFWHPIACFSLAVMMGWEVIKWKLGFKSKLATYGK